MTTLTAAKEAILARWVANWDETDAVSTFENEKGFDAPTDDAWVRVSIRHRVSSQDTLGSRGNRKFLRGGSIFIQIWTPIETYEGTQKSDQLVQLARTIFEGESFSGVRMFDVVYRETGNDGDSFQVVVEAFFEYDETK